MRGDSPPRVGSVASRVGAPDVAVAACDRGSGVSGRGLRGGGLAGELDPHVDGSCKLALAEDEACTLRDALIEWLG